MSAEGSASSSEGGQSSQKSASSMAAAMGVNSNDMDAEFNARKRRADEEFRAASKRKRLAHAMEELNLGTPASAPQQWAAPFGTRTRLRTSPRRDSTVLDKSKKRDSFEFGRSFKRALSDLDITTEVIDMDADVNSNVTAVIQASPTKRRRDNNSRALVLYKGPASPRDLISSSTFSPSPSADIWTTVPHSVPKVIIQQPPDSDDVSIPVINNNNSNGDMEVDEIIIAEAPHDTWNREKALITVPSIVQQRRAEFERKAKEKANLVHTQTAILMPWRDIRQENVDVDMQ